MTPLSTVPGECLVVLLSRGDPAGEPQTETYLNSVCAGVFGGVSWEPFARPGCARFLRRLVSLHLQIRNRLRIWGSIPFFVLPRSVAWDTRPYERIATGRSTGHITDYGDAARLTGVLGEPLKGRLAGQMRCLRKLWYLIDGPDLGKFLIAF